MPAVGQQTPALILLQNNEINQLLRMQIATWERVMTTKQRVVSVSILHSQLRPLPLKDLINWLIGF